MEKIKISIIIPVYNTERFLKKCLDSVINQSLKEIEIILINDGSTDNSYLICEEYARLYNDKIKYIYQTNKGCSATRNLGITLAKGKYIAFVDSDDYLEKEMYESLYEKAILENLDICICGIKYINLSTNEIVYSYPKNIKNKNDYLKEKNRMANSCNKIYKREEIINKKIFFPIKTHYAEDLVFSFKSIISLKKIGHIEKCYYNYILHGNNSIYNFDKRLGVFLSFKELNYFLEQNNYLKEKNIKKIYNKIFISYAVKGTFFLLMKSKNINNNVYKKYEKIFEKKMLEERNKYSYLKIKIIFYKNLSYFIYKFNLYTKLKKVKKLIGGKYDKV